MDEHQILLVGQHEQLASSIQPSLVRLLPGFTTQIVPSLRDVSQAVVSAHRAVACLILVDDTSDEDQVAAFVRALEREQRAISVFVILPEDDVHRRLRFLECGVVDCLSWPVDLARLAALIDVLSVRRRVSSEKRAANRAASRTPSKSLSPKPHPDSSGQVIDGFLFVSKAMRDLHSQLEAAADSDTHVLLTGETGTGKTHVSRAIHRLSPRRKRPFVVVECGGLSLTLLESELFGHVRGAFTGADRDHQGKFAAVADGTILLDEIDCVPMEAQAKLLRVLDDRVYEAVGSNRVAEFQGRVIAATNRPLDQLAAEGMFRSDLFYRLNVLEFRLPPLRDCREAIRPLAEHFLDHYARSAKRTVHEISFDALDAMISYDWPGNIRELRNCIHRAVTLCRSDSIHLDNLPAPVRKAALCADLHDPGLSATSHHGKLDVARQSGERQAILSLLSKHGNNRTRVAKELGISRVALYKRLRKLGIMDIASLNTTVAETLS